MHYSNLLPLHLLQFLVWLSLLMPGEVKRPCTWPPAVCSSQYPGWSLMADGSIRVAEATEDSLGTYTCVPYNALGTMGMSPPATLVLKVPRLLISASLAARSAVDCGPIRLRC